MATHSGLLHRKIILAAGIISLFALNYAHAEPVLRSRPKPPTNIETSLIWYKAYDQGMVSALTQDLDQLLEGYKNPDHIPGRAENLVNCDYLNTPKGNEVCRIDVMNWTPCTHEDDYGYKNNTPCVFLSLEKLMGWQPEFYNDTNTLPAEMPEDLKTYIAEQKNINPNNANQVWVSCSGDNPASSENIGPIEYLPQRGFPGYFFPFSNTTGNLSPLIAVHFKRPMRGVIIGVECKLWARNLKHTEPEKQGVLLFELLND
ncbi:sodium/potassium-transporting ATPase subunit beta-2-like [Ischnura elegans]|uniref:sodium/potassium-transporting ATPase subunit beta-2-like n=1 Tax=Ischnura elegans TaxID=197161 RepID=UPI001ED88C13|nr:sodium/potassium-transporting ATPase subunit beta-2-like [Ischnura elegans]XP_046402098.1 sodium/potassium-transporting ATPase subunit beta-2-like [Ischnura elegans]